MSFGLNKGEIDKIDGYHGLRPDDQDKVNNAVENIVESTTGKGKLSKTYFLTARSSLDPQDKKQLS